MSIMKFLIWRWKFACLDISLKCIAINQELGSILLC